MAMPQCGQQARRVAQVGRRRAQGGRDGQVFSPVCKHTQGRNWDPPAQVGAGTSAAPGLTELFFLPISIYYCAGQVIMTGQETARTRWRTVGIAGIFARGLLGGRGG